MRKCLDFDRCNNPLPPQPSLHLEHFAADHKIYDSVQGGIYIFDDGRGTIENNDLFSASLMLCSSDTLRQWALGNSDPQLK